MSVLTMTSREFNQSTSEAKKASLTGPVFITDRGKPSYVLLSIDEYRKLAGGITTLANALAQRGEDEVEFEVPRVGGFFREADLIV
ncbi:prevent-host-death protein [Paraburkholderia acidicola]|uniref:Antitoxin n=1 Tax=Paraburkholderia acidicola TaxID=1912599 RepID=A0A2A4EPC0_9BURK|nr:type II toxin-antitoxin system prevent-host-death family antitoxin [Paraburkholderia acidicola]PCE23493.1 prevent-host-death protein [Paraburkholderia acidicola]